MSVGTTLTLGLLIGVWGCQPASVPPVSSQASSHFEEEPVAEAAPSRSPQERALAARDALAGALTTRLTEAITKDGPGGAIDVCSREAPQIAERVGRSQGVKIGRTSFQLRNPKNAPPEWAQTLITGRPKDPLFVDLPDGSTGALLPILLQGRCITCHGPEAVIPDSVLAKLREHYPQDQATGFNEGDLRGWFWVEVPASKGTTPAAAAAEIPPAATNDAAKADADHERQHAQAAVASDGSETSHGPGFGRGMGRGMGRGGPGMMGGHRADMTTIHAMFDARDRIKRTVTKTETGAIAVTESEDPQLVKLIQEHVPAMEGRVLENQPLPPMTFHPIFVELIKHAQDYRLDYEEIEHGMKVTYSASDPFVIMLVQEHSQLVSRFLEHGMEEIHKEYELPEVPSAKVE